MYVVQNSLWIVIFKRKILKFYLDRDFLGFRSPIGGVGAPTPIFDQYSSSYKLIFIQNASKLHFCYSTKLVEYEYVKKFLKESPNIF